MTAIQSGSDAGTFNAKIKPVTTALKSPVEFGFLSILHHMYSAAALLITQVRATMSARIPNTNTPAISAGISAIITSSIIFGTVSLPFICGA